MLMLTWVGCVLAQMCNEGSAQWLVMWLLCSTFKGVRRLGVHVVVARSARSGRLLSESASSYGMTSLRHG